MEPLVPAERFGSVNPCFFAGLQTVSHPLSFCQVFLTKKTKKYQGLLSLIRAVLRYCIFQRISAESCELAINHFLTTV